MYVATPGYTSTDMPGRFIDTETTDDAAPPFDLLPDELLVSIFMLISYNSKPVEYVRLSCVDKRWHALVRDESICRRYIQILKSYNLFPNLQEPLPDGWSTLRKIYSSCEIYVDVSSSMGEEIQEEKRRPLSALAREKTMNTVEGALFFMKKVQLFAFADDLSKPFEIEDLEGVAKVLEPFASVCNGNTYFGFLSQRLIDHGNESVETAQPFVTIAVISDLGFSDKHVNNFFTQLRLVHQTIVERNNLNLIFIDVARKESKEKFKKSLKRKTTKRKIDYIHVVDTPKQESAKKTLESPTKKQKKNPTDEQQPQNL